MKGPSGVVDLKFGSTADADLAHLAGHQGGVGRDPPAGGQNAFGRQHSTDVFRARFHTNQENLGALMGSGFGFIGLKIDLSGSGTRTGGKSPGNQLGRFSGARIKDRSQQLTEGIGRNPADGIIGFDQLLLDHLHGDSDGGETGAFPIARLKHEKATLLDGKFEILHVMEMTLEGLADILQLAVHLGHLDLQLDDRFRGANASHHVFTLGIQEEFAVEDLFAGGGIAGKGNARAAVVTGVAEDHGLYVDGGAPFVGNIVFAAVDDRALIVPGAEDRTHRTAKLFPGILGKILAGAFEDQLAETIGEGAEGRGIQLGVGNVRILGEELFFEFLDDDFERLMILARAFLHSHDDVPVHLEEAPIAVIGEAFVLAAFGEGANRPVVEAEVENGVHHSRHGIAGA